MAPMLSTPFNRRDALLSLGTLFAATLGWSALLNEGASVAAAIPVSLGDVDAMAVLTAALARTLCGDDEETWRRLLRDGLMVTEQYSIADFDSAFAELRDTNR